MYNTSFLFLHIPAHSVHICYIQYTLTLLLIFSNNSSNCSIFIVIDSSIIFLYCLFFSYFLFIYNFLKSLYYTDEKFVFCILYLLYFTLFDEDFIGSSTTV